MRPELVEGHAITLCPEPVEGNAITLCPEPVEGQSTAMRPEPVEGQSTAMRPELVEGHSITLCPDRLLLLPASRVWRRDLALLPALTVWRRPRRRQGQALRVALRRLRASLDPRSGRRKESNHREQEGEWVWGGLGWVGFGRSGAKFDLCFSLFYWENRLVSNTSSNTMGACNSGIPQQRRVTSAVAWMRPSTTSTQPSPT
jgi:hypothetical protein